MDVSQQSTQAPAPPAWHPDPGGSGRLRWWDGQSWTDHLSDPSPWAPAHPAVHGVSHHAQPFRSLSALGGWVQALLAANGVLAAVGVATGAWQYWILSDIRDGIFVEESTAELSDAVYGGTGILQLLSFLACGVVFLVWLHRAAANLRAFDARDLTYSPGWAVGWWFVPFLNLVRPKQVLNEVWLASSPNWAAGTDNWRLGSPAPLLSFWWAAYVISNVVGWIGGRAGGDDIDGLLGQTATLMISDALAVVAAVLAVLVVRDVAQRQRARNLRQ